MSSKLDDFLATLPADMQTELKSLSIPPNVIARAMLSEEKRRKASVSQMISSQKRHGDVRKVRGEVIGLLIRSAIEEYGPWKSGSNRSREWEQVAWAVRTLDKTGAIGRWTGLDDLYAKLPPGLGPVDPKTVKKAEPEAPVPPPATLKVEVKKSRKGQKPEARPN